MKLQYVSTLLAFLTLAGCATNGYQEPKDSDVAHISNLFSSPGGSFSLSPVWDQYIVEAIDDQYISYTTEAMFSTPAKATRAVRPGKHKLLINAKFNRTFGGDCPCQSFIILNADLAPSHNYQLSGEVKGAELSTWLIDASTQQVVTEKVSSQFKAMPKDNYAPVYVPVAK